MDNKEKKSVADAIDEILGVTGSDFDFYDLPEEDFYTKRPFLRKGEGKLASQRHGQTKFSLQRKESFVFDQNKREIEHHKYNKKCEDDKKDLVKPRSNRPDTPDSLDDDKYWCVKSNKTSRF
tara:strand:- start:509 stop:874 length:366 start_codon:yes stop_codon:yes gene_type:complete